ncbi:MAG TPA: NUDIX domain-containing protein, partial [Gallionella sp.]|nr:NUDIX domain-containing protein [Gallionella sp.]
CALAYHERRAILDGNVKRVLARWCGIEGWAGDKKVEEKLWQQAEALLPHSSPRPAGERVRERGGSDSAIAIYIQAQMDMGATVCTRSKPKCGECPVQADCIAFQAQRVSELPTPRPRKAVPERHTTFLLLMSGRDILLEKRPSSGIWGGLWCPPQLDDGQGIAEDYVQRNGVEVSERSELAEFTHVFTHFKLHITPVLLRLARKPQRVQQPGSVWLDVEEALRAAIPTPVRKVLEQL